MPDFNSFAIRNDLRYRPGECYGNDIRNLEANLGACNWHCTQQAGCKAFLWNETYQCFLKYASCATTDTSNPEDHMFDVKQ